MDRPAPAHPAHIHDGLDRAGKAVMREAAEELKDITLELGGNDPAIVLDDANPKQMAQYVQRLPWRHTFG